MKSVDNLIDEIIYLLPSAIQHKTVEPIHVSEAEWKNELLFFAKPELFSIDNLAQAKESLRLIFDKFREYNASPKGIMILSGSYLEQTGIMDRHYGFINRLSKSASQIQTKDDLKIIKNALDIETVENYQVLGGHEYLRQYLHENFVDLDKLWFSKKSVKLRSGYYVQHYEKDGKKLILVNGFHPAQLAHFTDPNHRIVLFLLYSDTDWNVLRNEMIGATFPEKAVSTSLRGTLYSNPSRYGLKVVDVANNGVHLSAGPFEALFEITNFFGDVLNLDLSQTHPLPIKKLLEKSVKLDEAIKVLTNPQLRINSNTVDLFTATEDMNTEPAINLWLENRL